MPHSPDTEPMDWDFLLEFSDARKETGDAIEDALKLTISRLGMTWGSPDAETRIANARKNNPQVFNPKPPEADQPAG